MELLIQYMEFFKRKLMSPFEIELPRHQYIPKNAESLDIRKLCEIATSTKEGDFITLEAKGSQEIIVTQYATYTDAELADDVEFFFDLNGNRQLRYHGTPDDPTKPKRYAIDLGLAPDLSNNALINCYIVIKPTQKLTIKVSNNSDTFERPMGVRLVGYVNNIDSRRDKAIR